MIIDNMEIQGKTLKWILRCPTKEDATELSQLRIQIDAETENLDREPGEGLCTPEDFVKRIDEDAKAEKTIFIIAEVDGKIVGFARCVGNTLSRFRHKAEFGICISKDYWGNGIGKVLIENILLWADSVGIKKISLSVLQTNTKAIMLYEKYGFVQEGILMNDRIHKDGNYYHTVIMGRFSNKG